jgi:hypothetical protein
MPNPIADPTASAAVLKSVALQALSRTEAMLQLARQRLDAVPAAQRSDPEYRRQEAHLDRLFLELREALSRIDTCPATFIDLVDALEQSTPAVRHP